MGYDDVLLIDPDDWGTCSLYLLSSVYCFCSAHYQQHNGLNTASTIGQNPKTATFVQKLNVNASTKATNNQSLFNIKPENLNFDKRHSPISALYTRRRKQFQQKATGNICIYIHTYLG
jgi:hypothetical protein